MTSQQMVGWNLGSRSTETTSQPLAAKALPIDPVPLKSSRSLGILFPRVACEPDKGDQPGDEAGHLQVADHAVAPWSDESIPFFWLGNLKEVDRRAPEQWQTWRLLLETCW